VNIVAIGKANMTRRTSESFLSFSELRRCRGAAVPPRDPDDDEDEEEDDADEDDDREAAVIREPRRLVVRARRAARSNPIGAYR
jgi:hypothetical protein